MHAAFVVVIFLVTLCTDFFSLCRLSPLTLRLLSEIFTVCFTCWWVVAKDGKKVREKIRKIASKVEEEDFTEDLDMV